MSSKSNTGFTLVEVLIVVGLLTLSAVFFSQLYIDRVERRMAEKEAASLMTINAATVGFVQENGRWPDQANACADALNELITAQYLGDIADSAFGENVAFSCETVGGVNPLLSVTRTSLVGEEFASIVSGLLPSARATDSQVIMYVPRPRRESFSEVIEGEVSVGTGILTVEVPENCSTPGIVAYPKLVCSLDGTLGGFRINTDLVGDNWNVYLTARGDTGSYSTISQCRTGGSSFQTVSFSVVRFCQ